MSVRVVGDQVLMETKEAGITLKHLLTWLRYGRPVRVKSTGALMWLSSHANHPDGMVVLFDKPDSARMTMNTTALAIDPGEPIPVFKMTIYPMDNVEPDFSNEPAKYFVREGLSQ